jgi:putative oxidoreductase
MNNALAMLPMMGRILIGAYFAVFGLWNIYHLRPYIKELVDKNFPLPFVALPLGIFWQITAGVMIMFNSYVKVAALSLILFTVLGITLFHDFWNHEGEKRRMNLRLFIANLTISVGALLLLLSNVTPLNSLADFSN